MAEFIKQSVMTLFGNNPLMATFILALIPVFELNGAIPFGMSREIWGEQALSPIVSFLTSVISTSIIIPIIIIVFLQILKWLKNKKTFNTIISKFENIIKNKSAKIDTKNKLKICIGVIIFIALPLPLTGVYTGCCVAVFLGLNFYETLASVFIGNVFAGIIITLISTIFKNNTLVVVYAFLIFCIIYFMCKLISYFIKKRQS